MIDNPKTKVFISYSHYDKRWLDRLLVHLKPIQRDIQNIAIWSDRYIQTGTKWKDEIAKAIEECDIAILLISPDFLASDFISTNELPPLIEAAEKEGKLIIPLILSPSLFVRTSELGQFQAVNDPKTPILGLNEYDQEKTFLKLAETVIDRATKLKDQEGLVEKENLTKDDFLLNKNWTKLIRLGNWIFDEKNKQIIGSGLNSLLVSRKTYGRVPFTIHAKIKFSNFSQFGNRDDFINSGIIFGWETAKSSPTYYNILLTGKKLILERVGFKALEFAGQALKPYEHLDDGTSFNLPENKFVSFDIHFSKSKIVFNADGEKLCEFTLPKFYIGRVGIRAWRCQLTIKKFIITEL